MDSRLSTVSETPPSSGDDLAPAVAGLTDQLQGAPTEARPPLLAALLELSPLSALRWCEANKGRLGELPMELLGRLVERAAERVSTAEEKGRLGGFALQFIAKLPATALRQAASALAETDAADTLIDGALGRFSVDAGLLRLAADRAAGRGDSARAHELLTRLGRAEPTPGTLAHVLRRRGKLEAASGAPVRIALLSSYTIETLVPWLDLEARGLGLVPEIRVSPFNSWAQEVIDPGSPLRQFDPEIAFLSVALDDLVPALAGSLPPADLAAAGEVAVDRVLEVARTFSAWSSAPLVVHSFHSAHRDPAGIIEGRTPLSRQRGIDRLNYRLAEGLSLLPRAYLLDLTDLLLRRSGGTPDNPKMRHLASMRLGEQVLGPLALAYAGYLAPLKGLTRKVVAVDLDNTLWGGVIGEDGMSGIRLGSTAPGSEYVEFQRYLLSLTERGFLLVACSKNNPDDALEAIRGHEAMVLREQHFTALRINWEPKPRNLQAIAQELNLGVDSFIFVDDNPDERELMRQMLPQVLTVDLPRDPALYRAALEALPQLQTLVVTEEDLARVSQYRANRDREVARDQSGTIEDYLHSLGITIRLGPATPAMLGRIQQLFTRTNQFNTTTRRYDLAQVTAFAQDPGYRLLALNAADRFGDHGLVGLALVRIGGVEWTIDSFLMSCRVIGYGVESTLLAHVSEAARVAGAGALVGEFIATRKNGPARDCFARHGFVSEGSRDGVDRWRRSLEDGGVARPTWVTVLPYDG